MTFYQPSCCVTDSDTAYCNDTSSALINEFCTCVYLFSTGEYYSLSCEPTLGESQIFHSMVKRHPIRTRDAIKLIGDGQEQKLKKDRVIESWIKVKLYTHHLGCHATSLPTGEAKHCVTAEDYMTSRDYVTKCLSNQRKSVDSSLLR